MISFYLHLMSLIWNCLNNPTLHPHNYLQNVSQKAAQRGKIKQSAYPWSKVYQFLKNSSLSLFFSWNTTKIERKNQSFFSTHALLLSSYSYFLYFSWFWRISLHVMTTIIHYLGCCCLCCSQTFIENRIVRPLEATDEMR